MSIKELINLINQNCLHMYIWEKPPKLLNKYIIKMPKVKNKKTLTPCLEVRVNDTLLGIWNYVPVYQMTKKMYSYQSTMHFPINFFGISWYQFYVLILWNASWTQIIIRIFALITFLIITIISFISAAVIIDL